MKPPGPKTNLLVSIILSESTASLLELNIPSIEQNNEVSGSTCVVKPMHDWELRRSKSQGCFMALFQQKFLAGKRYDGMEVSPNIAYFSDTYRCDSEDSIDTKDELDSISIDYVLEKADVYTRPLVTAKSVAHEGRIFMEDNNIYVDLLNEGCTVDMDLICRICHGGESIGDLLSPCRCRGSIALAHMECLEHWLRESMNSHCELCNHRFQIIRQPRHTIPLSILLYIAGQGENYKQTLIDMIAFLIYTPSALVSTYLLMIVCENIARMQISKPQLISAHIVGLCAIFGMAAIDFTYSSWLIVTFQRQLSAWRIWYRKNSILKLVLPEWKKRPFKKVKLVENRLKEERKDENT